MNQKHIYNIFLFDIWWNFFISMIFYTEEIISPDNIIYMTWVLSHRKQSQISVSIASCIFHKAHMGAFKVY